jgi:outer membrane protein assembly factor BamE (lipoprotein component of BamABCDE complex)
MGAQGRIATHAFYRGRVVATLVIHAREGLRRTAWRMAVVALLSSLLALFGCDADRIAKLEEGMSTEADVRRAFGEPVTVTVLPDGSRMMEYPRQPEGWTNYEIRIGTDGVMSSLRQLLNEDNLARVQPGQTRAEVRTRLGRPARMQRYGLSNEEVWDWRFRPAGQTSKLFSVSFDAGGTVTATSVTEDPRETAGGPST